jgi:hypothetical protein
LRQYFFLGHGALADNDFSRTAGCATASLMGLDSRPQGAESNRSAHSGRLF